jgi:hypothetical protein
MNSGEHQSITTLAWDAFPECLRTSFRRAGWALVNLPTPEELLERAWTQRVKWVSAATMWKVVTDWRGLAVWLADRGIRRLDEVTADDLDEYAAHLTSLGQRRRRTALMQRLAAAAIVVVSYLSGMRPAEVLNLRAGCCPEPADDGHSSIRYEIHGNFFKGARDDDGKAVTGGLARQTPWTVILPVVRAIRVLEQMTEGVLLFPVRTPWAKATPGNRSRPGEALTCEGARHRIRALVAWVNDYADQTGLRAERACAMRLSSWPTRSRAR